ncbi:MAG: alanine/ornithine racemase family PLP-dependent enzyme [Tissierellia bacterium]|nr:alanine/ornithine racemase family PLP-dependent enzyme [Tissierellia bacterium]
MNYPKLKVNTEKIKHNVEIIVEHCKRNEIKVAGVTKVFCGEPKIANAYIDGGVDYLADSRIENLIKLKDLNIPKILLRLPMQSEAELVVEYTDISLNSEIETIKILSEKAVEKGIIHKIILMVDLGDLREGYYSEEDLYNAVEEILKFKGIELMGIGTNLTCYGGVIPDENNLGRLVEIGKFIEEKYNINLEITSGGNSSSLYLIIEDNMVKGINNIRLGESLILGRETAYGKKIENTHEDAFQLEVEIIEIKEKPSIPIGKIGMDAFGREPSFVDKGIRKRIIAAIGKQDIEFDTLISIDQGISILGGSSDHLLLDGTESSIDYKVGDTIKFNLSYGGILSTMTSEYVKKEIV